MKFCGACGAPQVPGDLFCQKCGRAYSADEPPVAQSGPTETPAAASPPVARWAEPDDEPFPSWATGAAVGAVLLAPFISLIVALVMRSDETRPSRRAFLKSWAIWSGVWLCTGFLLFAIVACSAISSVGGGAFGGGGCKGGPDPFAIPSYTEPSGSTQWTAHIPCVGGGEKTRPARPGEVPGG